MRFAGLKNTFNIHLQPQLEAFWGDVIMTPSWQLEMKMKAKHIFETKYESAYSFHEYGILIVFIRYLSAEIWGFRNGLTLGIGTQKNMAGTGVFVRVVCALNCATKSDPSQPSMILAHRKIIQSRSPQK
jgi:hypothetical protein